MLKLSYCSIRCLGYYLTAVNTICIAPSVKISMVTWPTRKCYIICRLIVEVGRIKRRSLLVILLIRLLSRNSSWNWCIVFWHKMMFVCRKDCKRPSRLRRLPRIPFVIPMKLLLVPTSQVNSLILLVVLLRLLVVPLIRLIRRYPMLLPKWCVWVSTGAGPWRLLMKLVVPLCESVR